MQELVYSYITYLDVVAILVVNPHHRTETYKKVPGLFKLSTTLFCLDTVTFHKKFGIIEVL